MNERQPPAKVVEFNKLLEQARQTPVTPEMVEAQRQGFADQTRGERQAAPVPRPYVSIDIETTGLDPKYCQVLEVGAVIDDWVSPLSELKRFHCYVQHERIVGEPLALVMNAEILRALAEPHKHPCRTFLKPADVCPTLVNFLLDSGFIGNINDSILAAGKNFASFDMRFFRRLPHARMLKFSHRFIDPAMRFWNPLTDREVPNSKTCMERAGIPGEVAHTAVEDALAVVKMIRASAGIITKPTITNTKASEVAKRLSQQFYKNGQYTE
jgi:DNA polymerase III epsilon subunit-like protein